MDLNAMAQLSALVVAVLNARADPLAFLNFTQTFSPFSHTQFKAFTLSIWYFLCSST